MLRKSVKDGVILEDKNLSDLHFKVNMRAFELLEEEFSKVAYLLHKYKDCFVCITQRQ